MPIKSIMRATNGPSSTGEPSPLVVSRLSAFYGPARALASVSFEAVPGEVLGIIGENGAGKSTLLRSISRVHRQASGSITYADRELIKLRSDQVSLLGLSFVRDGGRVFENLTIDDHLALAQRLARKRGREPMSSVELLESFPLLAERGIETKAGFLSGGQRQALCLAMAVGGGATCILLDEPSAGLAESTASSIFAVIRGVVDEGVTLVIAEQDTRWLEGLADRVIALEMGQIVERLS